MTTLTKLKHKRGRLKNGKIGWKLRENINCMELVKRGLYIKTISKATGLTHNQISRRCKRIGISVLDYRNGEGPVAETLVKKFTVHYS